MPHRSRNYHHGFEYVDSYPGRRKWLNQCLACQYVGYKPEMPDPPKQPHGEDKLGVATIFPREEEDWHFFKHIRESFEELPLNKDGLCSICAK
jgi:hypothetical protein